MSTKRYNDITYEELYKLCLDFKLQRIKLRSIKAFKDTHRIHILPVFKDKIVSEITRIDIQNWQKCLLNKRYKDRPYSNRMLDRIQVDFKNVLIYGLQYGYLDNNPFIIPKVNRDEPKKEMQIWSVDEFKQFISVVEDLKWKAIFTTLYYSGLRIGELIALNVRDYDGFNLNVNKSYDPHNQIVTTPKTKNSYRAVALNKATRELLDELLCIYTTQQIDVANQALFGLHTRLSATSIERKKNNYCKLAKVKQIKIHEFRHSHVSLLINLGFQPIDIANRLGHTVTMVNEVYGHLFDKSQKDIVSCT